MGRLEQRSCRRAALNCFTFNLLMLGLVIASSPMMSTALKPKPTVRDVRRTFRAALAHRGMLPAYWLLLARRQPDAFGISDQLAARVRPSCARGAWLLLASLRARQPRARLWLSLGGIALNALISWSLIFGKFGLPALGLRRRAWKHADLDHHVRRLGPLSCSIANSGVFVCSNVVALRPQTLAMIKLGWPIGATMALEMGVFALAAYFMGWIRAPALLLMP